MGAARPFIRRLADVRAVPCPCGQATRIITGADDEVMSIHRVKIEGEAKKHYHKIMTERYIVLEGSGEIELDDARSPVGPGDVIHIPPGTRHALRGIFEIINVVSPPFTADDEYVVE